MTDYLNDPIECAVCPGRVHRVDTTVDVPIGARGTVPVRGTYATCDQCGEIYFGPGEGDAVHRAACDVVREREGLLIPEEIRSLRMELGLSQAQFEQLLRVGPKTVVRWERGTIFQNRATDTLLRGLRDVPEMRAFLMSRAGLQAPEIVQDELFVTLEYAIQKPTAEDSESGAPWSKQIQWAPLDADLVLAPDGEALAA